MRTPAWLDLLRLPEERAGWKYLSSGNQLHQRWILAGATFAAFVVALVQGLEGRWLYAVLWGVVLVANVACFLLRNRTVLRERADDVQLGLLVLFLAAIAVTLEYSIGLVLFAGFGFNAFAILLRWRGSRLLIFVAALLAMVAWAAIVPSEDKPLPLFVIAPISIALTAWVGWRITLRRLATFLEEFRRQAGVERDRARMSEELSDARTVQLSMLPRAMPELPWVDVASACLPATEVGGDYYDFLVLDDDRLAVIVGDVAGHGMASGLVLAGLRSGLYLLRDQLDRPDGGLEVLERLDGMLQDTSPGRMFVTLQIALVDRRAATVTVANAGHPPLMVISAGGASTVGAPGPPLGTRLEGSFGSESRDLAPGDTLVLFTDGVSEVRNHRGESFDGDRLETEVVRAAEGPTARAVRDQLLARLSHFKGDAEQEDDVTLVVLRLAAG